MLIRDYCEFVEHSDWTKSHNHAERRNIAQYGIASEIGSLVSAVKKKLLVPGNSEWDEPNDEIVEELGDIVWYTALLSEIDSGSSLTAVLKADFLSLSKDIEDNTSFRQSLDIDDYKKFVTQSKDYVSSYNNRSFSEYQKIAFLTSRTSGKDLLHVCLTRLLFYATVLLSKGFPQLEKLMQKDILDLPVERALGMIMWHVAAIATLYKRPLDTIATFNISKLEQLFNLNNESPTPLHDEREGVPDSQKLPRQMEISFVSVGKGRLQMYWNGARLGDELTDNARKDDGYRFHDIMHLANIAKLGWSPVLRGLMKRKRKYDPLIDKTEDGARAQIVEEAVVKAIHSEGERIAGNAPHSTDDAPIQLFTSKEQIPFSFLKLIVSYVKGLEVAQNRFWEWQEAIVEGHRIYAELHREGQGTISINLADRSIVFDANVAPALKGAVVGTGIGQAEFDDEFSQLLNEHERDKLGDDPKRFARLVAQKGAILRALGLSPDSNESFSQIRVVDLENGEISVKGLGSVQEAMWRKGAISFQSVDMELEKGVLCYAIALGDIPG